VWEEEVAMLRFLEKSKKGKKLVVVIGGGESWGGGSVRGERMVAF